MPEVQKPISVCQVEESGAKLLQARGGSSAEKLRTQLRCRRRLARGLVVVFAHCGASDEQQDHVRPLCPAATLMSDR
jgi:hypothetical protein